MKPSTGARGNLSKIMVATHHYHNQNFYRLINKNQLNESQKWVSRESGEQKEKTAKGHRVTQSREEKVTG